MARAVTRLRVGPAGDVPDLTQALAHAEPGGWLWLLAPDARPEPDALDRLTEAAERLDVPPALLSSLPVGGGDGALPRGAEFDTLHLIAVVPHGLIPIRHAGLISLLVDGGAVGGLPAPDPVRYGVFADRAWTATLLARTRGYMVAASRVLVSPPPVPGRSALGAIRHMREDGLWTQGESVRAAVAALKPGRRR